MKIQRCENKKVMIKDASPKRDDTFLPFFWKGKKYIM